MKVAFFVPYDEVALGPRYLSSVFALDGHETHLIFLRGLDYVNPQHVPPPEVQENDPNGYYGFTSYISGKETQLFLDLLERLNPDWIGLSFFSINFGMAKFLTQAIRSRFPNKLILWGGIDTKVNSEENIHFCDVACIGEGEWPMREFMHRLNHGRSFEDIPSLWINKGGGEIIKNARGMVEQNLDNLPWPDFEVENKHYLFDDQLLDAHFPPISHLHTNFMVMGSRGCAFTCTYCHSGHSDVYYPGQKSVRARSVDNVINELKYRINTWPSKIERIEFFDDILPLNPRWIENMGPRYKQEIGLPFWGYTHPNVRKPEVLKILGDAGAEFMFMGIQTGSQRTLRKYYDRKHSKEAIMEAMANIRDAGIRPLIDLIGHNPLETEADCLESLDLLCDMPRPYGIVTVNPMCFYDNYRILDIARREGIMDELERPKGVHAYHAKLKPEYVFWSMLYMLAQFDGFKKETLMRMAEDEHLRKNPKFLMELVENLKKTTYMDGNVVMPKDNYIGYLRWRLHQIESSPVYKAYQRIKKLRLVG